MQEEPKSKHFQKTAAIIPTAGAGIRMGGPRPKQYVDLDGRPLLFHTLVPFQHCREVDAIVLVVPSRDVDYCRKEIIEPYHLEKVKKVVPGGKRRQDSVRLGLEATEGDYGLILIHDGVRPVIDRLLIAHVIETAMDHRAVITALPAMETVKQVDGHRRVVKTYNRQLIWLVQTPQAFRYEDISMAHQEAVRQGWNGATDDSALLERLGIPVFVVEGAQDNIKVTTPHDLEMVRFLLHRKKKT